MIGIFLKKPASHCVKPNCAADPAEKREYDQFGPWMLEIGSEEEMPPCFRSWYPELRTATFLFKIPVHEERRDLMPGMPMYRAVLAADEDGVTLLERSGSEIGKRRIGLGSVVALRHEEILLNGELILYLRGGETRVVAYNTVSGGLVQPLVDFLRARFPPAVNGFLPEDTAVVDKFPFGYAIADLVARDGRFRPIHCEAEDRRRRLFRRRAGRLGNAILDNGEELAVVTRGKDERLRGHEAVYGISWLFLPFAELRGYKVVEPNIRRLGEPVVLSLRADGHEFDLDLECDASVLITELDRTAVRSC